MRSDRSSHPLPRWRRSGGARRRGLGAALLALAILATAALATAAAPPAASAPAPSRSAAGSFELAPCNRTYRMRGAELAPVAQGALTVALRSPENHLTLASHRLELVPRGDGTHDALFVAEFSGAGDLVADVTVAGVTSRLADPVTVPRQERTVQGRVRLVRGEDGFEITPLELPKHVSVSIESQLAQRFAALCQSFALIPGMGFDCDPLRAALSQARVPMPETGETYLLPPECVTPELSRRLDAYLRQ